MTKRRVVVTGVGAVTPVATGAEQSWQALCQGKSGVARITRFDASSFKSQIAAEVKDFHPDDFIDTKSIQIKIRRTDQFIDYASAATRMALEGSGLAITGSNASRVGMVVGSYAGGISTYEKTSLPSRKKALPPFLPSLSRGS
jgi:3-oxoacyl-[acyl-carrier-protein] synthase II